MSDAGDCATGHATTGELEANRLEQLWAGRFGDDYVDRNTSAHEYRQSFWSTMLTRYPCRSVLEVGCNTGANLRWIAPIVGAPGTNGVDVNHKALATLRKDLPDVNAVWAPARELPFPDSRFELVFTMGVLIHQPDTTLPMVMSEMVRCSRRYVMCGEYHANSTVEVPYRGQTGALFKRDYGRLFTDTFPSLEILETSFLGRDEGWDDVTVWLFARTER
jgi:pseudaminic acid biosynthesis-associated methylase